MIVNTYILDCPIEIHILALGYTSVGNYKHEIFDREIFCKSSWVIWKTIQVEYSNGNVHFQVIANCCHLRVSYYHVRAAHYHRKCCPLPTNVIWGLAIWWQIAMIYDLPPSRPSMLLCNMFWGFRQRNFRVVLIHWASRVWHIKASWVVFLTFKNYIYN